MYTTNVGGPYTPWTKRPVGQREGDGMRTLALALTTFAALPAAAGLPSAPGGRVAWREVPTLRPAPKGVGEFLAGVESRLPPEMGTRYRDKSRVTWCHETT